MSRGDICEGGCWPVSGLGGRKLKIAVAGFGYLVGGGSRRLTASALFAFNLRRQRYDRRAVTDAIELRGDHGAQYKETC